jgi:hypothetical protein
MSKSFSGADNYVNCGSPRQLLGSLTTGRRGQQTPLVKLICSP